MPRTFNTWFLVLAIGFLFETVTTSPPPFPPVLFETDNFQFENPNARAVDEEISLNYHLPNDTYPEHYDIKLSTNVHTGELSFQGEVVIDVVVARATNKIVLHARQLKISKVTLAKASASTSEELSFEYELEREFLTLARKKNEEFPAGTQWQLTIIYAGELRNDTRGFYLSTYINEKGNKRYLATTQFESTDARHAFPCYDEPDKRANFTITISHSPNYTAISNMPLNVGASSAGKSVFLTTARISTYIVAFIVSDFESTEGTLKGLTQHVYSRPGTKQFHEWALVSGLLITERLAEYYGVEFMLPKIDHVAVPQFAAGGMENWGLTTYREEYLLYDKNTSTVREQTSIANVVAHEIAHQWFGDYVAIKWWTYLWLKEGFATLFSYRALDDTYPEWGVWQEFHVHTYQLALISDANSFARPMTHYVQKPNEIGALYDYVSYSKAGSVLYMWSNALTDTVFKQGLHNYLTINQYNAAVEEQLFSAIQTAAKEQNYRLPATISEMFSTWTRQGGYPILTVTRNYDNGTFHVKQEVFYNSEPITGNRTWYVPINFAVASDSDFRHTEATHYLLGVAETKIDDVNISKKDWLILNKQSTGYYRIKYDAENYQLITDSLIQRPFKIHPRNRAQLIQDAFHFTLSINLDHAILLRMLSYLEKEDQYAPWATAASIFQYYYRYLNADVNFDDLKLFAADQIGPIYAKVGINDIPGEQHYQKYIRDIVINFACLFGVQDCLIETNKKLKDQLFRQIPIEPNLIPVINCAGFQQAGDEEFYLVYNQLMNSTDQALQRELISGLACSQNETHIKTLIYSSIDETNQLHSKVRTNVLNRIYPRGEVGLLACIDFLLENWHEYGSLQNGVGSFKPLDSIIRGMAAYVTNKDQEQKLLALVAEVRNSELVEPTLEADVKIYMSRNFKWLERHRDPIMSWMAEYHADHYSGGSASIAAQTILNAAAFVMTGTRVL